MDNQAMISAELHKIHRGRIRIACFPTILIYFASLYLQSENLVLDKFMIACLVTSITGLILHLLINEVFYESWQQGKTWARVVNAFAFCLLSLSWGIHFFDLYFHYGALSPNVSYTLILIVGFITVATHTLLASKESYYWFVLPMSLCVIGANLFAYPVVHIIGLCTIILFLVFSIRNFRAAHAQLCDLILFEVFANPEKERLRGIINTVPGFVGLIDGLGVCYMANRTAFSLYPDIVGKKIGGLDPTSEWEKFVLDFMSSAKSEAVSEQKTMLTGNVIHALLNVRKMEDGGVIVVSVITTELVEARIKIREQEAHAQYTAKLASLGEMAAGIAHEVNNPLTIILGSANIMKRVLTHEPVDKELLNTLADKMVETTGRISKTIKSLKALSRNAENDPMLPVSIGKILDLSLDLCHQNFKNNDIELKKSGEIQSLEVIGREVQLSQIIVNLLNNAIDAVKTLNERWVEFRTEVQGEFVNVYVIDSGRGIPKEIQGRIMEPFFTTKDVNQGTGLGLSISNKIIQEHGGELTLLPAEAHTTFLVRLKKA